MSDLIEVTCGECGCAFGLPERYESARREDSKTFYCPNGHPRAFRESTSDKLRRERDQLKQEQARYEERLADANRQREGAERRASAARGQVTRIKNRASAGVCPCCNRTISQLARHMKTKHPDFSAENVIPISSARDQSRGGE